MLCHCRPQRLWSWSASSYHNHCARKRSYLVCIRASQGLAWTATLRRCLIMHLSLVGHDVQVCTVLLHSQYAHWHCCVVRYRQRRPIPALAEVNTRMLQCERRLHQSRCRPSTRQELAYNAAGHNPLVNGQPALMSASKMSSCCHGAYLVHGRSIDQCWQDVQLCLLAIYAGFNCIELQRKAFISTPTGIATTVQDTYRRGSRLLGWHQTVLPASTSRPH